MTTLKKKLPKNTKNTLELEIRGKTKKREIINHIRDVESLRDIQHYVHKGTHHVDRD